MEEEKSKGEKVYGFSVWLFILSIILGVGVFFVSLWHSLSTVYSELAANYLISGMIEGTVIILLGKFLADLLECVGEIEINTKKVSKMMSNKRQDVVAFLEEPSQTDEPCFIDWLLEGLKISKYGETFKVAGVREYSHFMKLSEEDLKKLGLEENDIKRLLNTQIKMKVTR